MTVKIWDGDKKREEGNQTVIENREAKTAKRETLTKKAAKKETARKTDRKKYVSGKIWDGEKER